MSNAFLDFLGDNPNTRLLEFLITGREFDYTLTDMAKNAGISWSTLHRVFPKLQKQKIVIKTRSIGRAKLFKINLENQEVKKLVQLFDSLLVKQLEKYSEMQVIKAKA
ncbi:MAG: hypothetical protein HYW50_00130 [Candidatus Diapherotrites archaeon]|nr:hypothetical protein [Candidatus Diapherotrites archaeon]